MTETIDHGRSLEQVLSLEQECVRLRNRVAELECGCSDPMVVDGCVPHGIPPIAHPDSGDLPAALEHPANKMAREALRREAAEGRTGANQGPYKATRKPISGAELIAAARKDPLLQMALEAFLAREQDDGAELEEPCAENAPYEPVPRLVDFDGLDLMLLVRDQRNALCEIAKAVRGSREDWQLETLAQDVALLVTRLRAALIVARGDIARTYLSCPVLTEIDAALAATEPKP